MLATRRGAMRYALGFTAVLAGCSFNQSQMTLDQVKAYVSSFVSMVNAGAQVYLASAVAKDKQLVQTIVGEVQNAAQAVQNATAPSDVKSLLLQIVQFVQEIEPYVASFLGPDAPLVGLGLAVLQAIINAVPMQQAPSTDQMDAATSRLKAAHPGVFRS